MFFKDIKIFRQEFDGRLEQGNVPLELRIKVEQNFDKGKNDAMDPSGKDYTEYFSQPVHAVSFGTAQFNRAFKSAVFSKASELEVSSGCALSIIDSFNK